MANSNNNIMTCFCFCFCFEAGSSGSVVLIININAQKEKPKCILHEEPLHTHLAKVVVVGLGSFSTPDSVAPGGGQSSRSAAFWSTR